MKAIYVGIFPTAARISELRVTSFELAIIYPASWTDPAPEADAELGLAAQNRHLNPGHSSTGI